MALNSRAEHIYEIASIWLNECLFNDGSLFWPDREVWTRDNLDSFWTAFAENLDEGQGSFVQKWAQQLSGQSDDVHRMAVEVSAIYCLFPASKQMGVASKRKLVGDVLAFSGDLGEMNPERWSLFERAIDGGGIGLTGAGYLAARPFHIGMYLGFAKTVKSSGAVAIADLEPKSILEEAFDLVSGTMKFQPLSTKHILLHILWPDLFEDYASADYKKMMAKNLSAHFGLEELDDIDATILQARKHMEANGYKPSFSMYDDEIEALWNRNADKISPEPRENISPKFALAAQFRERVLENNGSFLWPDDEEVWTPENAHAALDLVKHLAGKTYGPGMNELIQIASDAPRPIYQILCDTRAAIILNRKSSRHTSEMEINRLLEINGDFDGDQETLKELLESSDSEFPGVILSNSKLLNQYLIVLHGITSIISHPETIGDRDAMVQQFWNTYPDDNDGVFSFPFWGFLFLVYPEQIASLPGAMDREHLLKAFTHLTDGNVYPNDQAQMADIRKQLDPDFDPYTFDFYADPWRSKWLPSWRKTKGREVLEDEGIEIDDVEVGDDKDLFKPTITDLARATHLDESRLREIETLLNDKQQMIFEGPPGSGKTFVAEKFARYFTGQPLKDVKPNPDSTEPVTPNEQIEIVQFHQSYSYEDFVEGIRPDTNENGQLVYKTVPGIFRVFADKAAANPDRKFVLIIDEINRGNVSRILGELMLLLEYRDKSATLPYSKEQLTIPPNLYIIGTMNSADRSLSQIDYALRRRFYFVRFMSVEEGRADVLARWLDRQGMDATANSRVVNMFVHLNSKLSNRLGTDDLQVGHSYFMRTDIHDPSAQEMVWKYAVMPLLREYLYHDRERDDVLATFGLSEIRTALAPPTPELEQPETVHDFETES